MLPSAPGIYAIVHVASGRRYVGSAVNIKRRVTRHVGLLTAASHVNPHLQGAWNLYGADGFSFTTLELCAVDELIQREQHHIDARADFNLCRVAGSSLGVKRSAATIEKMRATKAVMMEDPEYCEHLRAIGRARAAVNNILPQMAEVRVRTGKSRKGEKRAAGTGEKIRAGLRSSPKFAAYSQSRFGHGVSDETREKIGAAHRGRKASATARANLSIAHTGLPWSDARRKAHNDRA